MADDSRKVPISKPAMLGPESDDPADGRRSSQDSMEFPTPKLEKSPSGGLGSGRRLFHSSSMIGGGTKEKKKKDKGMLPDADEMKRKVRANLGKKTYDVRNFYHDEGVCQSLARNHRFEQATLLVIVLNALYMAIDTDLNKSASLSEAHAIFQVFENLFCFFFTGELSIRFGAFARKCNCARDAWFVFDSVLVITMVGETWVMAYILPGFGVSLSGGGVGNAGILRLLRLLRLSRMSRMARLLRSVPELMILLKGMGEASSSCAWTALLLIIAMYIWALALKQLSGGTEFAKKYFPDIPHGMYNLMITGCFMKGFNFAMDEMKDESIPCFLLYFIFVLFSGVTIMKMLTGMLCKVINAVAASETEKMSVGFVKDELLEVLWEMGYCGDAKDVHSIDIESLKLSQETFAEMMHCPRALDAFRKIGIDAVGLVTSADFIFPEVENDIENEDTENWDHRHEHLSLPFADFMENILQLRGSNTATVKDMVEVRKFVRSELREVEHNLAHAVNEATGHASRKSKSRTSNSAGSGASVSPSAVCFEGGSPLSKPSRLSANAVSGVSPQPSPRPSLHTSQLRTVATPDSVFHDFCELNQAERARFFSLLADGAGHRSSSERKSNDSSGIVVGNGNASDEHIVDVDSPKGLRLVSSEGTSTPKDSL